MSRPRLAGPDRYSGQALERVAPGCSHEAGPTRDRRVGGHGGPGALLAGGGGQRERRRRTGAR